MGRRSVEPMVRLSLGLGGLCYVPAKGKIFFEPQKSTVTAMLWGYYTALARHR